MHIVQVVAGGQVLDRTGKVVLLISELPAVSLVIRRRAGSLRALYHRLSFLLNLLRVKTTAKLDLDEFEIDGLVSYNPRNQEEQTSYESNLE